MTWLISSVTFQSGQRPYDQHDNEIFDINLSRKKPKKVCIVWEPKSQRDTNELNLLPTRQYSTCSTIYLKPLSYWHATVPDYFVIKFEN